MNLKIIQTNRLKSRLLWMVGLIFCALINISQNALARENGDACTDEEQAAGQALCDEFFPGSTNTNCHYVIYEDGSDGIEGKCAYPGASFNFFTSPGSTESFDFSPGHVENGEWQNPNCTFTCTGVGNVCPSTDPLIFEEISEPGQPLECQNLNFSGSSGGCEQLANQTCHQTIYHYFSSNNPAGRVDINGELPPPPPPYVDPNPRGETVYQSFWWIPNQNANGFQNQQFDPTQLTDPTIHFESIIGPQGEPLDAVQYFNNMAVQQLIDRNKNTVAPAKK